jgi:Fe2+ or Zn2+ uptake regulation protein
MEIEMITKQDKEILQLIFDKVNANAPLKAHMLMAELGGQFPSVSKHDLRAAISDLVERGVIVEVQYSGLTANGLIYFPAETRFDFSRRNK